MCYIFLGSEDPSEHDPGSVRHSDGSSSGSASGSPQEETHLSPLQEYILNLTEEEWMVFSSMLHTPMTRTHFMEICLAILKVVSLSSITVVLPAYVCIARDGETSNSRSSTPTTTRRSLCPSSLVPDKRFTDDESERATSSPEITGGPVSQMLLRMKGALANLRRAVVCQPSQHVVCEVPDSAGTATQCSMSHGSPAHTDHHSISEAAMVAQYGGATHDLTCIARILERLLSSGNIDQIAKNLVGQIQAVWQGSSPTPTPVDDSGKSSSGSENRKIVPQRTLSASQMVYSYTEEAIKGLLQPYLLPLVAWNVISETQSTPGGSHPSGHPHSSPCSDFAATKDSLLGLDEPKCSCLVASFIQRLPAKIHYQETADSSTFEIATSDQAIRSSSHRFSEVANVFTKLMTSQVMDIIDSEMERHVYQNKESSKDEPRILSSADKDETVTEGEILGEHKAMASSIRESLDTSPGTRGGLFSRLIQRFLSEFRYTDSALDAIGVRASASSHSLSQSSESSCEDMKQSASEKLGDILGHFTEVMVHQVMDVLHTDSKVELGRDLDQVKGVCNADKRPQSSASSPSSSKSGDGPTMDLDVMPDGHVTVCDRHAVKHSASTAACGLHSDSNDNGCLVTVLMLQLLAKMKDQQTASTDIMDSQKLVERLLSEFSSASGTPDFNMYQSNMKIQSLYRTMDKLFLSEFGCQTILQTAVDTKDSSFDNILMSALRKELLQQCDVEVTAAPSSPSASPPPEPVPGAVQGQTDRKMTRRRFNFKHKEKCTAPHAASDANVSDMSASGQKPRKRSLFIRMFACCIQGSAES
ncbi:hypothetical protein ACEWY4_002704 [Coilia grayii]|uniref:Uncharacterized protein n=1 Tax=Coilia grayii TaxID=363190 RepID=A0ABD1KP86_9TELE